MCLAAPPSTSATLSVCQPAFPRRAGWHTAPEAVALALVTPVQRAIERHLRASGPRIGPHEMARMAYEARCQCPPALMTSPCRRRYERLALTASGVASSPSRASRVTSSFLVRGRAASVRRALTAGVTRVPRAVGEVGLVLSCGGLGSGSWDRRATESDKPYSSSCKRRRCLEVDAISRRTSASLAWRASTPFTPTSYQELRNP